MEEQWLETTNPRYWSWSMLCRKTRLCAVNHSKCYQYQFISSHRLPPTISHNKCDMHKVSGDFKLERNENYLVVTVDWNMLGERGWGSNVIIMEMKYVLLLLIILPIYTFILLKNKSLSDWAEDETLIWRNLMMSESFNVAHSAKLSGQKKGELETCWCWCCYICIHEFMSIDPH